MIFLGIFFEGDDNDDGNDDEASKKALLEEMAKPDSDRAKIATLQRKTFKLRRKEQSTFNNLPYETYPFLLDEFYVSSMFTPLVLYSGSGGGT